MRSSLFALVGLVGLTACSISTSDGGITLKTQTRYVEDNVTREAPAAWAGEKIEINAQGTGISVNGGLKIQCDSNTTTVKASARMLAYADADDKTSADTSIIDAKATFTITTANGVTSIACGHGGSHGTSSAGNSGCEYMIVTVPGGTSAQKVDVKGLSGNGGIVVTAGGALISSLALNSNGGDIDITADANQGSTISAVSEKSDDITLHLPTAFAADKIVLVADPTSIDISAFPDVVNNQGRGAAGTGATVISLESKEFAGTTGKVILAH